VLNGVSAPSAPLKLSCGRRLSCCTAQLYDGSRDIFSLIASNTGTPYLLFILLYFAHFQAWSVDACTAVSHQRGVPGREAAVGRVWSHQH
jgi:hypothetical protein